MSGAGKGHMEKVLEEHLQKGGDVQKRLNETTELREQQKNKLRLIIADLQTKLMEVQLEKDALQDSRQKESQSQENVKIQLQNTIQGLEAANQLREERLREADSQTEHLQKVVHNHEGALELRGILLDCKDSTGKNLSEHEKRTGLHIHSLSTAFADILQDLDSEVSSLKERVVLVEEELESLKKDSWTQKELLLQQHQNREQARDQNSVCAHQLRHLESTASQLPSELQEAKRMYEDKVKDLEKQLHLACSEIAEAETEEDQYSQESGNLNNQFHQLMTELQEKEREPSLEKEQNKRFWDGHTDNSIIIASLRRELDSKAVQLQQVENTVKATRTPWHRAREHQVAAIQQRNESIGRISSLTVQLESAKETLRRGKDLAAKQMDLETAEKPVSNQTACLQGKERTLEVTRKETKKLHSQLGRRVQELRHLQTEEDGLHSVQSECETLKLQLLEKEKVIEIFQKQIGEMTQVVGHHSQTAGAMEAEKSQLIKEINEWKLKAEGLKIAKDEKEARIHEMEARLNELELEKFKLVNICSKRLRALHEMKLEKAQLMKELQAGRSELAGLAEGFEDLQRDYQGKIKEMENTANRLKMQLKCAQGELEQTRTALKTMEGSDGHALKVAVGMQKKITAKRGQIDALQSKIKFLEEAMTNAAKEKHFLREENSKLSEELSCITAENTKIAGKLEILRLQDKRLKEKISKMETALDKASMQFAEYQCIIQCQEQAALHCRLQHALGVKELQVPGSALGRQLHVVPLPSLHSAVLPPPLTWASCASQMPPKPGMWKEEPLQDLKRIVQELTSLDNDITIADLGRDDSSGGRKSPLAAMRSRVDPSCLPTAGLQSQDVTLSFTPLAPHYRSSSKKVSQEQRHRERSPVHLLLTSPPDELGAGPGTSPEHRPWARTVAFPEGAATVPQITSQPVDTSEKTPRRLQKKMRSQQNLVESFQRKSHAMSSMVRTQEMATEKAKEKEKKLSE